jgi:hypothetical protein
MKKILFGLTTLLLLAGCKTSKDYLLRADDDRTLFDVVKKLNKRPDDANAFAALPLLYIGATARHIDKINIYNSYTEINRWDKIIEEYSILQKMHDAIINSVASYRQVTPLSYQSEIGSLKQMAAEDYYNLGTDYLAHLGRDNAKKAYGYFKKSNQYISNFKDANHKMDEAYGRTVVNVIINPIQDNSFFINTGWGNSGYNYSNEYFQQTIVREMGGSRNSRYAARFYTDWDARRDNVLPDWTVDLTLKNLDIPRPSVNSDSRSLSKQVENGKDSSGRTVYETVKATLNISRRYFTARGQMDVNITDQNTQKNISYNSYNEDYHWEEESATYSGDSRALSNNDWSLVNNNRINIPSKEEILNELYRKIYPKVKNRIIYSVDW